MAIKSVIEDMAIKSEIFEESLTISVFNSPFIQQKLA